MSSSGQPGVSIIVPMYNASQYIDDLIDSIISQSFKSWELIIIDDHSSDDSFNKVLLAAKTNPQIKLIKRPSDLPKGGNSCRNYGLSISTGKYVMFIDADDLLANYCINQRFKTMEDNPHLDFAIFPALTFKRIPLDYSIKCYGVGNIYNSLNNLINKALPFVVWNNIYRREALSKHQIVWDQNLLSNQDADFNISCLIHNLKFEYFLLPPDYFWRQDIENSCSKKILSKEHAISNIYYFNKISQLFDSNSNYITDIKILAIWIIKALLKSNGSTVIESYLKSSFFQSYPFFKVRLKIYAALSKMNESHVSKFFYKCIPYILFPILTIKNRKNNNVFPWNKKHLKQIKFLETLYRECISSSQKD